MVKKKDDVLLIDEPDLNSSALLEDALMNSAVPDSNSIWQEEHLPLLDNAPILSSMDTGQASPLPETVSPAERFEDEQSSSAEDKAIDALNAATTFEQNTPIPETAGTTEIQTANTNASRQTDNRRQAQQILAIDEQAMVSRAEDNENRLWMTLRNAQRSHHILSSTLSGIERLENGLPLAIVYYQGMRIAIPATEMALPVHPQDFATEAELYNRYAQLLSRMLAAEIDFTIAGLDRRGGVILGSRKQAMQRKQQRYYHTPDAQGNTLIHEGQIAEARVISVSEKLLRVEVFGIETNITAREIAWEWVDDAHEFYQVGNRVPVKVQTIRQDDEQLAITVSIREAFPNPTADNLKRCSIGGKYIGTVTGIENIVYVRLNIGVNAIATTVRDPRAICHKDEVSFVVTRIDSEAGLAIGIITRIIKQAN